MRSLLLALILLCTACAASATESPCPSTRSNEQWSAACFDATGAVRRVKPQYLRNIVPNKSGMAVIVIAEPFEVVAVDRRGVVVVPGIASAGDFDYPHAEGGIGRFYAGGKCGYFRSGSFQVVVPPEYAACRAFREGEALACRDCMRYCTDEDCHDSKFVGGQGFVFDARGRRLRQFALPRLEESCGKAGVAEVGKLDGGTPLLRCKNDPDSPFKM